MFKIDPNPTFEVTVLLPAPGQAPVPVKVTMRYRNHEQYYEMFAESRKANETTGQMLGRFIDSWDEKAMGCQVSPEVLEKFAMNHPRAATAMVEAYRNELVGAPQKNF